MNSSHSFEFNTKATTTQRQQKTQFSMNEIKKKKKLGKGRGLKPVYTNVAKLLQIYYNRYIGFLLLSQFETIQHNLFFSHIHKLL